jgi:hypothetical protein
VAAVVTEYLDAHGPLAAVERAQLEQHLLICQNCADFVIQNRLTVAGLRALAVQPLPAASRANLLAEFRKRKGQAR